MNSLLAVLFTSLVLCNQSIAAGLSRDADSLYEIVDERRLYMLTITGHLPESMCLASIVDVTRVPPYPISMDELH